MVASVAMVSVNGAMVSVNGAMVASIVVATVKWPRAASPFASHAARLLVAVAAKQLAARVAPAVVPVATVVVRL